MKSEWIQELKVGDEVAVDISNDWNSNYYIIETVAKITPTGKIRLSNGTLYHEDGRKVGGGYIRRLLQITPEIIDCISRRKVLNNIKFDAIKGKLSLDQLITIEQWQREILESEDK